MPVPGLQRDQTAQGKLFNKQVLDTDSLLSRLLEAEARTG